LSGFASVRYLNQYRAHFFVLAFWLKHIKSEGRSGSTSAEPELLAISIESGASDSERVLVRYFWLGDTEADRTVGRIRGASQRRWSRFKCKMPYRDIAQELTNRNIPAPRGGHVWNAITVMRVMK
jgi:hypothetical protein